LKSAKVRLCRSISAGVACLFCSITYALDTGIHPNVHKTSKPDYLPSDAHDSFSLPPLDAISVPLPLADSEGAINLERVVCRYRFF
jgi:hypothetical protein